MEYDARQNRLASSEQDFAMLRETLGVSGVRRVNSDLIDSGVALLTALLLSKYGYNPWYSLGYFFIRDLPPINRSFGKAMTGITIYSADSLMPAFPKQLLIRGLANFLIVIPLGVLVMTFFVYVMAVAVFSGFIFFMGGKDSELLRTVGYDYHNGQTLADRIAGTHLIQPRDVNALREMSNRIDKLRAELLKN